MTEFAPLQKSKVRPPWRQFLHILRYGDIGMMLIVGGAGLMAWALFGLFTVKGQADLAAYAAMFPLGSQNVWAAIYILCGLLMWLLVAYRMPFTLSVTVGGWVVAIWSWALLARAAAIATQQTGNATSMIYIVVGMLIISRAGRRK